MLHIGQFQKAMLVGWSALPDISLSAIKKLWNRCNDWNAIWTTIIVRNHCNPEILSKLLMNIVDTIYEPCIILKHHTICICPPNIRSFACSSSVLSRSVRCAFSYTIWTNGFPLATFHSDDFLIVRGFTISIWWCAASCSDSLSSVGMACIILFTAECNSSVPCNSMNVSFSALWGAPDKYHIIR